jgi:hypothetical protein
VAFLGSERAESRLAEMLLSSTLGGMSYRKVVRWARLHLGIVISTAWVGRVVDAVWVHYRRGARGRAREPC